MSNDKWRDEFGTFDQMGVWKTLRQLESEGWKFDYDGSELREIMKNVTFDEKHLKLFSISVSTKKEE